MRTFFSVVVDIALVMVSAAVLDFWPPLQQMTAPSIGVAVRNADRITSKTAPTHFPGSTIDAADLVINWGTYRHQTVAVRGLFRCLSEDYCAFIRSARLRMTVTADISSLPPPARRHLILECVDGCDVILVGNVDDIDIFALSIADVPANES